jgi:hypothetical protein
MGHSFILRGSAKPVVDLLAQTLGTERRRRLGVFTAVLLRSIQSAVPDRLNLPAQDARMGRGSTTTAGKIVLAMAAVWLVVVALRARAFASFEVHTG